MASVRQLTTPNREGKRPWVVNYVGLDGKRRQATPKSGLKKDADKLRQKIEREIEEGTHTSNSETATVREVAEQWLRWEENKVRAGNLGKCTWNNHRSIVNRSINPKLGSMLIAKFVFTDVENWHASLLPALAPVTAKNHLEVLKQIEDFARKRSLTRKQIATEVLGDIGHTKSKPIKTFKIEEVQSLVELVEELNYTKLRKTQNIRGYMFLKSAVQLAAFCGLRMGEIYGLTIDNIDFKSGVLKIRHSLTQLDELKGPKTRAGKRDVPMPDRVADTLRAWVQSYYVQNDRRLAFRMPCGKMITPRNFRSNYWVPLLERAGLHDPKDTMHFHALRHFAASLMIDLGLPLTDVASLMGHESFDMTLQVYAHPIVGGNRRREAFERISTTLSDRAANDANATLKPKLLLSHA